MLAHGSEVWYRGDGDQSTLRTLLSKRATFRMSTPFFGSVLSEDFPWCVPTQTLLCELPRVLRRTCPARLQLAIKKSWEKKAHHHPIPLSLVSLVEHFEARLARLGCDKSRVAHVGDSLHHDIAGAAAAGIASILITSGIHATDLAPTMENFREMENEGSVRPTHVVPAFRL